jgi:chitin disaccharide deacetylase
MNPLADTSAGHRADGRVRWATGALVALLLLPSVTSAQVPSAALTPKDRPYRVMLRLDDLGMCHAVNLAARQVIDAGIPFSASVMFACPWYQEAVEILRAAPQVSVGIHLTLNAEWKNYRWGPVAGAGTVPSLVDSNGYFFPSRSLFFSHGPKIEEVEKELRSQITRALASGLPIDYVDYHMGTAVDTPELRSLVEKLAKEYGLAISRYFGEVDAGGLYAAPIAHKRDTLLALTSKLSADSLWLFVFHVGLATPEMVALVDLNTFGLPQMAEHRQGELEALLSEPFQQYLRQATVRLLTYRDLVREKGLQSMTRPAQTY